MARGYRRPYISVLEKYVATVKCQEPAIEAQLAGTTADQGKYQQTSRFASYSTLVTFRCAQEYSRRGGWKTEKCGCLSNREKREQKQVQKKSRRKKRYEVIGILHCSQVEKKKSDTR
eukprot:g49569.t1